MLHRYLYDMELVTDLITFVTVFAARDEWLEAMGALGLVNKTVIVMSRHSEDRAAVLSGVHLLRAMHRDVVRSSFEGSNVVMQLVECVGKYLLDIEALMDILTLLDDMCEFDPERLALGEVTAMRSYSNNKELQRACRRTRRTGADC